VKWKEVEIAKAINQAPLRRPTKCAQEKQDKTNVLDGSDFVRDVLDSHSAAIAASAKKWLARFLLSEALNEDKFPKHLND
jgi:hypothetical protein